MKPAPFDYLRAGSTQDALDALAHTGEDARVLAGGQSLMAVLNMRLAQPRLLIDISRTEDLDLVRIDRDHLVVSAAATQGSVEWRASLQNEVPLLALAFPHISHFQIRNRGTVCGSIAHADPSSELPLALAVSGGEVVLSSARGTRILPASEFQQDMLTTAREADELVAAVRFPVAAGQGVGFHEVARRHGDFAIIAVAAAVENDKAIRVGVGGMAGRPMVRSINGNAGAAIGAFVGEWAEELEGYEDLQASAALRRDLFRNLGPHVIAAATKAARKGEA